MSLVGLPPLAGFIGKWWILIALGSLHDTASSTLGWFLMFVAVINTLISLFYYLRVVVKMALEEDGQPAFSAPFGGVVLVNVCAVALIALFVLVHPLKATADRFSHSLFETTASLTVSTDSVATATDE